MSRLEAKEASGTLKELDPQKLFTPMFTMGRGHWGTRPLGTLSSWYKYRHGRQRPDQVWLSQFPVFYACCGLGLL